MQEQDVLSYLLIDNFHYTTAIASFLDVKLDTTASKGSATDKAFPRLSEVRKSSNYSYRSPIS